MGGLRAIIKKSMQHILANKTDNVATLYVSNSFGHEADKYTTLGQLTLLTVWLLASLTWLGRLLLIRSKYKGKCEPEEQAETNDIIETGTCTSKDTGDKNKAIEHQDGNSLSDKKDVIDKKFSKSLPVPTIDQFLRNVACLGLIMVYFYLCDYVKVFPAGQRTYNRDTFLFIVCILLLVALTTIQPTKPIILNRDQTEEWKGWMQVLFVWYHYFAAKEWYNWIRIYIACYVWMTGFGNFSFFWVRKDFSLWRISKMLFRLNFLVIIICNVLNNDYMLYYICAMHTYWFISVYATMAVLPSWNQHRGKMALKFAVYATVNAVLFDVPGVCEKAFKPAWFIFGYHESRHGLMHEWAFRGGLDHWACFIGMLCAYNYPYFEAFIHHIENDVKYSEKARHTIKCGIICVVATILSVWYLVVMDKDKYSYNSFHPYTSSIPIISFVILRNLYPTLRSNYLYLFNFLGKITLETYLCQLHIYLQSNAKQLISYIPGYCLLNFVLATSIYMFLSYSLFHITVTFSSFLLPKDLRLLWKTLGVLFVVICGSLVLALFITYR